MALEKDSDLGIIILVNELPLECVLEFLNLWLLSYNIVS